MCSFITFGILAFIQKSIILNKHVLIHKIILKQQYLKPKMIESVSSVIQKGKKKCFYIKNFTETRKVTTQYQVMYRLSLSSYVVYTCMYIDCILILVQLFKYSNKIKLILIWLQKLQSLNWCSHRRLYTGNWYFQFIWFYLFGFFLIN